MLILSIFLLLFLHSVSSSISNRTMQIFRFNISKAFVYESVIRSELVFNKKRLNSTSSNVRFNIQVNVKSKLHNITYVRWNVHTQLMCVHNTTSLWLNLIFHLFKSNWINHFWTIKLLIRKLDDSNSLFISFNNNKKIELISHPFF